MSKAQYSEIRKKQPGGRYVWGVLQMEGRKQQFRTVGEGEGARRKAIKLPQHLSEMEKVAASPEDRFLSWHRSGEPLPLDRAIRDHARAAKHTVAVSTAERYGQFAERVVAHLGDIDLRHRQKEDIGRLVRAERADGRAKDPTINACVLLRGTVLAALRTKDEFGRRHMVDDPLPTLTKIARQTANDAWRPSLDDDPSVGAWKPEEARDLLELGASNFRRVYGVCLFQAATGSRIGGGRSLCDGPQSISTAGKSRSDSRFTKTSSEHQKPKRVTAPSQSRSGRPRLERRRAEPYFRFRSQSWLSSNVSRRR
jgi:hypothetical protein